MEEEYLRGGVETDCRIQSGDSEDRHAVYFTALALMACSMEKDRS